MASPEPQRDRSPERRDYAVIVIGSGISGLFVALEARKLGPVLVLTKGSIDDCNTRWAQGGIAAAVGPMDTPAQHLADTIAAGDGLVDPAAARVLCDEAPARIHDLVEYGVSFDALGGEVALGREAAHSHSRILHAGGDRTGAEIETALTTAVRDPQITVLDFTLVTRLVIEGGNIAGVEAVALQTGERERYESQYVVLATGGAGQLFSHTTNPDVATGDGVALAFEAGAEVADLEFYQFHPTALRLVGAPPFLISEAVRGEGAVLRNAAGEEFMARYHELKDLAPRDVVARAIVSEMRSAGSDSVLLDCSALKSIDLATRFPGIYAFCRGVGIDMRTQPIPVAPAAHYMMGGVRTDIHGRTTIAGLYACGEVACTGVHGANRLASNSLMETVVFGKRVVEHIESGAGGAASPSTAAQGIAPAEGSAPSHEEVQRIMWASAGIERDADGMDRGIREISAWPQQPPPQTRSESERRQMSVLARSCSPLRSNGPRAAADTSGGISRGETTRTGSASRYGSVAIEPPPAAVIEAAVQAALAEDRAFEDVTTLATVTPSLRGTARFLAKEAGVLAGMPVALAAFRALDSTSELRLLRADGDAFALGEVLAEVSCSVRAMLQAERVALNFLQRLSGTATLTAAFVQAAAGTDAVILDTRKTTPGLRDLEKYAVRCGGGTNHRRDLAVMAMIKDNHREALARGELSLAEGVAAIRARSAGTAVEVEIDSLDQLEEALAGRPEWILLDNMAAPEMAEAVRQTRGRAKLEASGGVALETVRAIAETGVDAISVGALTHSAGSIDISLDLEF